MHPEPQDLEGRGKPLNVNEANHRAYEGVDPETPIDVLEPEERKLTELQKAGRIYTRVITYCLDYIKNSKDPHLACIAISYALGQHQITDGKAQREMARELQIGHSTISNRVVKIQKEVERIIREVHEK